MNVETHDFGAGPVPAHRHPYGGGWIAETAIVGDDVYVGQRAEVAGGTIKGGTIKGGIIRGGTIEGGTIWSGTIRGGTIWDGTIEGGTIEGGIILGGIILGGTIWGGTIWDGTIEGGTIEGGTIWGGTIKGGTIWGGTIKGGTIEGGSDYLVAGPQGSRDDVLTCVRDESLPGGRRYTTGCFTGSRGEFECALGQTHVNAPEHVAAYRAALAYFDARLAAP